MFNLRQRRQHTRSSVRARLAVGLPVALVAGLAAVPVTAAAAEPVADCTTAASSEAAALIAAMSCHLEVQITDATSETTQAWALPDGTIKQEISAAPERVKQGDDWLPIDLTLVEQDDGTVAPRAHPDGLAISGAKRDGGSHTLATVGEGSDAIAMGITGPLPKPRLEGTEAVYSNVQPGIDLVVQATLDGVESFFVVKSRAAAKHVEELDVPITGSDVTSHKMTVDGRLTLFDGNGDVIARSPTPLMWDARIDPDTGDPLAVRAMGTEASTLPPTDTSEDALPSEGGGVSITIKPDRKFLSDPRTVYPVTIDPQITLGSPTWDSWVRDGVTEDLSTRTYLEIGLRDGKVSRAFVNFDTSTLIGKQITSATVGLGNYLSASCNIYYQIWTVGAPSTSTRWTNQPTWRYLEGQSKESWGGPTGCTDANASSVDATSFFQRTASEQRTVGYMGIRATNEASSSSQKRFYSREYDGGSQAPFAVVKYAGTPALVSRSTTPTTTCTTGSSRPPISTLTPTLSATYTGSGTATTDTTFEVRNIDTGAAVYTQTVKGVPVDSKASMTVPDGTLSQAGNYGWRVRTASSYLTSPYSTWCEFNVAVPETNTFSMYIADSEGNPVSYASTAGTSGATAGWNPVQVQAGQTPDQVEASVAQTDAEHQAALDAEQANPQTYPVFTPEEQPDLTYDQETYAYPYEETEAIANSAAIDSAPAEETPLDEALADPDNQSDTDTLLDKELAVPGSVTELPQPGDASAMNTTSEEDWMTRNQCASGWNRAVKVKAPYFWKNKFSMCQIGWLEFNRQVGVRTDLMKARVMIIGNGSNRVRAANWYVYIDKWQFAGSPDKNQKLTVNVPCQKYAATTCKLVGGGRTTRTVAEWQNNGRVVFKYTTTTTSVPTWLDANHARERVGWFSFSPIISTSTAVGLAFTYTPASMRCDNAPNVTGVGGAGCVSTAINGSFVLNYASKAQGESVRFIWRAMHRLSEIKPNSAGLYVPGGGYKQPLTGNYQPLTRKAYGKNSRAKVRAECARLFGEDYTTAPPGGFKRDCDEYPFAATYQNANLDSLGTASTWAVYPVDFRHNRSVGGSLGQFYRRDHMLDMDPFYVAIINAP